MAIAFTRAVSPLLPECALTHLERQPIDPSLAARQHEAYEQALRDNGYEIIRLPELPESPDGVFVEDTAVLVGSEALITRPGAQCRSGEGSSTAQGLEPYFTIRRMETGHLDGGDVLRVGKTLYVGLSTRTDDAGAAELARLAEPLGFRVMPLRLQRCLHLKTAVSFLGQDGSGAATLLINADWIDPQIFEAAEIVRADSSEPFAANAVRAGDSIILPAGNPRTAKRLRERGFDVVEVDVSELQKAEAGVTCMSLIADD